MTIDIFRSYNPQTRVLSRQAGGTEGTGGVKHDSDSVRIHFTLPKEYLADKSAYIIFDVPTDKNWYSFNGKIFTIPRAITSMVTQNKLEYQLIFIGKKHHTYIEQSRADMLIFSKSLCDLPNNIDVIPGIVELTQLKEAMNDNSSA